jgi:hypothetical protein
VNQRFARFVYPLRLAFASAVLFIAAMTSLPADSVAGCTRACRYEYFYDAALTQPAGDCYGACYPGGAFCVWGAPTDYYRRSECEPCPCGPDW